MEQLRPPKCQHDNGQQLNLSRRENYTDQRQERTLCPRLSTIVPKLNLPFLASLDRTLMALKYSMSWGITLGGLCSFALSKVPSNICRHQLHTQARTNGEGDMHARLFQFLLLASTERVKKQAGQLQNCIPIQTTTSPRSVGPQAGDRGHLEYMRVCVGEGTSLTFAPHKYKKEV